ncbi:DUF4238 domain-containing protein [Anabaena sp. WFMT]|uniref:DUF4238 domain-containing protein n=1 Tax=Anabaena sp. WFMT TaxID=3449730 RepID=UPI003F239925
MDKIQKDTIKEHYVPRFYLEKFAYLSINGKYKIWVFDKQTRKIFPPDITDTGTGNYFYDFPTDIIEEKDKKVVDQYLQTVENEIAPFISKFEHKIHHILTNLEESYWYHKKVISKRKQIYWANIFSLQILRTPRFRQELIKRKDIVVKDATIQVENKLEQYLQDLSHQGVGLNINQEEWLDSYKDYINNIIVELCDEFHNNKNIPLIHGGFITAKYISDLSQVLVKYIWLVGINQTSIPLYTSDHPFAVIPHLNGSSYLSKGIEIIFPINPKLVFILRERTYFKNDNNKNCKLVKLTKDDIEKYNEAQFYSCKRFIYSKYDDFRLFENLS